MDEKTMILFVDHHAEKESELEAKLNQPGYSLVKVDSSIEGFRRLLDQNFALILLRVLPGMDHAVDLIKRLAKMGDIPLLDLSVVA